MSIIHMNRKQRKYLLLSIPTSTRRPLPIEDIVLPSTETSVMLVIKKGSHQILKR
jgi:hypothetical protein